jgi:hypothetical protein
MASACPWPTTVVHLLHPSSRDVPELAWSRRILASGDAERWVIEAIGETLMLFRQPPPKTLSCRDAEQ